MKFVGDDRQQCLDRFFGGLSTASKEAVEEKEEIATACVDKDLGSTIVRGNFTNNMHAALSLIEQNKTMWENRKVCGWCHNVLNGHRHWRKAPLHPWQVALLKEHRFHERMEEHQSAENRSIRAQAGHRQRTSSNDGEFIGNVRKLANHLRSPGAGRKKWKHPSKNAKDPVERDLAFFVRAVRQGKKTSGGEDGKRHGHKIAPIRMKYLEAINFEFVGQPGKPTFCEPFEEGWEDKLLAKLNASN